MVDDKENPESGAGEAKPLKIKAEDNPWYLLATLYDVPNVGRDLTTPEEDAELTTRISDKNRVAWNRYLAANLDEKTRAKLIQTRRPALGSVLRLLPPVSPIGNGLARR